MALPVETCLVAAYALLLAAVAAGLEWAARRVHRRSEQFKTAGFDYQPGQDVWNCPGGEHLHRQATEQPAARVVYRAPAHACNRCALKPQCTDSDTGRTLVLQPDAWVDSTMARFHRGLSLTLLLLAELGLGVESVRVVQSGASGRRAAAWLLAALMLALGAAGLRLARQFFRPSGAASRSQR